MPKQPNDQERTAFETFARHRQWSVERNAQGAYSSAPVGTAWEAWQARASVQAMSTGALPAEAPLKLPQAWSDAVPGSGPA